MACTLLIEPASSDVVCMYEHRFRETISAVLHLTLHCSVKVNNYPPFYMGFFFPPAVPGVFLGCGCTDVTLAILLSVLVETQIPETQIGVECLC